MKKITKITALAALGAATMLSSCRQDRFGCIRGDGPTIPETRTVSDFEEIEIQSGATVYVIEDSSYSFTATAQENILENLILSTRNGKLLIKDHRCVRGKSNLVITIHVPEMHSMSVSGSGHATLNKTKTQSISNARFTVSGSGQLVIKGDIHADDVYATITGSGNIEIPVIADDVFMKVTGSGEIYASGKTTHNDIEVTGSGEIQSFQLISDDTYVNISGSGKSEVYADKNLDVNISGSGSVYYKGWPRISTRISGSGKVVSEN
jgi:Putative auto-transporter adhesin, head GIN domain